MACNCKLSLEDKACKNRLSLTEQMALESVEITVLDYLESQEKYLVTIHDKHFELEAYITKENLNHYYDWGLVLNPQDL